TRIRPLVSLAIRDLKSMDLSVSIATDIDA
ncbi:MAG: hypothetical protein ACI9LM_004441, partial [Alteromonadaceae bacterium]